VNRNSCWGEFAQCFVQNIVQTGLLAKNSSHVHWTVKMAFLMSFEAFLVIYFIIYYPFINEEVNIYEQYVDSMRQFAM